MMQLTLNGQAVQFDIDPEMPLLWVLREHFHLVGAKFGCGKGLCGACTVHLNGQAVPSCLIPIGNLDGSEVTTIEGLAVDAGQGPLHPVQQAWIEESVPQCGYCQSGQIMSAAALLADNPQPSDAEVKTAMAGNLCRCGTYDRVLRAIRIAAERCHANRCT